MGPRAISQAEGGPALLYIHDRELIHVTLLPQFTGGILDRFRIQKGGRHPNLSGPGKASYSDASSHPFKN